MLALRHTVYEPTVPVAGVPDKTPIELVNETPEGKFTAHVSERAGAG